MSAPPSQAILSAAKGKRVICIGDVMLDRFIYGAVERVSPEAPVPVLRAEETRQMAGGAANVALNVLALGVHSVLVGVIGDDDTGEHLYTYLCQSDELTLQLLRDTNRQTPLKQRFVASGQQILRVDEERPSPVAAEIEAQLIAQLEEVLPGADLILLSDYDKGTLSARVLKAVINLANDQDVPVIVDPKGQDYGRYGPARLIKPNARELGLVSGMAVKTDEEVAAALVKTLAEIEAEALLVTRGAEGLSYLERGDEVIHLRGLRREVFDVSGAGDTVLSALGTALVAGVSLAEAAPFALVAGGIAVGKSGTAIVSAGDMLAEADRGAIGDEELARRVADWRAGGERIGFTNGCFDLLHPGHLSLLEAAAARCDRLIVGLNSDASVRRLKGAGRPVNPEGARARMLASFSAVDAVSIFDEDTPARLIEVILPDLLVKGADYEADNIVGAETVRRRGGEVFIAPLVEGYSTSALIARSQIDEC